MTATWTGGYWNVVVTAEFGDQSLTRVEITYPRDVPWDEVLGIAHKATEQVIQDFPEGGKVTVTIE